MNHISIQDNINEIIVRYLNGEASDGDVGILLEWIKASDDNQRAFCEMEDVWYALNPAFRYDSLDLKKAQDAVFHKTKIKRINWFKLVVRYWSRIAAVVMLPLLILTIYFITRSHDEASQQFTIATNFGCIGRTELPDGSIVWLNANSSLTYPVDMAIGVRTVRLYGEGYFDVKTDKEHPFTVIAQNMTVVATGTEFNVDAYSIDASVTLTEGRVKVSGANQSIDLKPGDRVLVNGNKLEKHNDVDIDKYCGWRNGILIFDDTPLGDICNRLENIYNVEMKVDPGLSSRTFHFVIKGESLEDVLKLLEFSAPVKCTVTEGESNRISTVKRKKISISPA